jgi:acetyl esterase
VPASPEVQAVIDLLSAGFPDVGNTCLDVEEARRILAERPEAPLPPVEVAAVENTTFPGPGGDVAVRIFTPEGADASTPVVVYLHGGGWALCDLDTHDRTTRRLCRDLPAVVVSVDYGLAPENRFPGPAEDTYAAVTWAHQRFAPERLAVAGDSAGGNLSAAVCLMARDRGGPAIDHQLLVYPVIDHSFDTGSYTENGEGYFLTRTNMEWFWSQYLGDDDGRHPYASPLRADHHSDLPSATVVTAELDPLRDEGNAYAAALAAAGVPTRHLVADGMFHGFFGLDEFLPVAAPAWTWAVDSLREGLR